MRGKMRNARLGPALSAQHQKLADAEKRAQELDMTLNKDDDVICDEHNQWDGSDTKFLELEKAKKCFAGLFRPQKCVSFPYFCPCERDACD